MRILVDINVSDNDAPPTTFQCGVFRGRVLKESALILSARLVSVNTLLMGGCDISSI